MRCCRASGRVTMASDQRCYHHTQHLGSPPAATPNLPSSGSSRSVQLCKTRRRPVGSCSTSRATLRGRQQGQFTMRTPAGASVRRWSACMSMMLRALAPNLRACSPANGCRQFFWNYSNPDAAAYVLSTSEQGPLGTGSPYVDGTFLDDSQAGGLCHDSSKESRRIRRPFCRLRGAGHPPGARACALQHGPLCRAAPARAERHVRLRAGAYRGCEGGEHSLRCVCICLRPFCRTPSRRWPPRGTTSGRASMVTARATLTRWPRRQTPATARPTCAWVAWLAGWLLAGLPCQCMVRAKIDDASATAPRLIGDSSCESLIGALIALASSSVLLCRTEMCAPAWQAVPMTMQWDGHNTTLGGHARSLAGARCTSTLPPCPHLCSRLPRRPRPRRLPGLGLERQPASAMGAALRPRRRHAAGPLLERVLRVHACVDQGDGVDRLRGLHGDAQLLILRGGGVVRRCDYPDCVCPRRASDLKLHSPRVFNVFAQKTTSQNAARPHIRSWVSCNPCPIVAWVGSSRPDAAAQVNLRCERVSVGVSPTRLVLLVTCTTQMGAHSSPRHAFLIRTSLAVRNPRHGILRKRFDLSRDQCRRLPPPTSGCPSIFVFYRRCGPSTVRVFSRYVSSTRTLARLSRVPM